MDRKRKLALALFDFDGVICDTESQYTRFWNRKGKEYLGDGNFGMRIKGQTLTDIYAKYFSDNLDIQKRITEELNLLEKTMTYDYVPGVVGFMTDLRLHGVKMAIVTSSNKEKMRNVYNAHPELEEMVDRILTGEMFRRSKPAPDCFLLGMEIFGVTPDETFVFEDSFHGLQAGMDSGAIVFGVATTNSREAIGKKAHQVIDNFMGLTYDKLQNMV